MEVLTDDLQLEKEVRSGAAFVYENIIECLEGKIFSWPKLKIAFGEGLCFW